MVFLILALVLFALGLVGSLVEGASEVWLWFLACGLVLDFSLVLLILTDWHWLRRFKAVDTPGRLAHFVMFVSAGLGFWFRLKAENDLFSIFMILSLFLWVYSFIRLKKSLSGSA